MFNQKVNHYLAENPDYVNSSLGAPYIRATDIHKCGTTILNIIKENLVKHISHGVLLM